MKALLLTGAPASVAGASVSASPADGPFLAKNTAAMAKMMKAMDVKATGNADKDFVATMVPHPAIRSQRATQTPCARDHRDAAARNRGNETRPRRAAPPSVPAPDQPSAPASTQNPSMSHQMQMH